MLELLFLTCAVVNPTNCKNVTLNYSADMSAYSCMMRAQPELAKWVNENPQWQVKQWKCRVAGRYAKA